MRSTRWSLCGLFVVLATVGAFTVGGQAQSKKLKALIVTGFDAGSHKWHATTELARATLEKTGRFDVRVAEDEDSLRACRFLVGIVATSKTLAIDRQRASPRRR